MNSLVTIIATADGSSSLYHSGFNETYHSRHGAIAESEHVYIENGLKYLLAQGYKEINIFEVGFGTGLNTILTYKEWQKHPDVELHYTAIENYPLGKNLIANLVFEGITNGPLNETFTKIHGCAWGEREEVSPGFTLLKLNEDILTATLKGAFNLVYYDAFAPSKQPPIWEYPILEKVKLVTQKQGVWITYCAQSKFKKNLQLLGFEVDALQGPHGKHEITRGIL